MANQGCALAERGGLWRLTSSLGQLGNLSFFIQIICWAPQILQFQSTGLPSIFLRARPWPKSQTIKHQLRQASSFPTQGKYESCMPKGQAGIQVFFSTVTYQNILCWSMYTLIKFSYAVELYPGLTALVCINT